MEYNDKKEDKITLQDTFLSKLKNEKALITIFLVNGVKLEGFINNFDNFSLCLQRHDHLQLVYKHAISTILPLHPIKLFEQDKEEEENL